MNNNNKNNPVTNKLPSEEVLQQILVNEGKKLALQEKRFVLEEANQKRQYEYACKSLEAQKEILRDKPKELRRTITRVSLMGAIVLIVLLVFFGFCIYMNKEQVVIDIVKYLGLSLLSFAGGTFYGKSKSQRNGQQSQQDFVDPNV